MEQRGAVAPLPLAGNRTRHGVQSCAKMATVIVEDSDDSDSSVESVYGTPNQSPEKQLDETPVELRPVGRPSTSGEFRATTTGLYPCIPLDLQPPATQTLGKARYLPNHRQSTDNPKKQAPRDHEQEIKFSLASPKYNTRKLPSPASPTPKTRSASLQTIPGRSKGFQAEIGLNSDDHKSPSPYKLPKDLRSPKASPYRRSSSVYLNNQQSTPAKPAVHLRGSQPTLRDFWKGQERLSTPDEEKLPLKINIGVSINSRSLTTPDNSLTSPVNTTKLETLTPTPQVLDPASREIKSEPRSSTVDHFDVGALARAINKRSPSSGVRDKKNLPTWDDALTEAAPSFFYELPKKVPSLLAWGSMAKFANGLSLKSYQAIDLQLLLNREKGEKVCGTEVVNNVGYLVGYPMGYGKTVLTIALILLNQAPDKFKGSRATLVLCPTQGIMIHWRSEIEKFAPKLNICFFDSSSVYFDKDADVILMTYDQLRYQRRCFFTPTPNCNGHIFYLNFWRICKDESHVDRNPNTKLAEATLALNKVHAICLTGTPVQNSWRDLYVTFAFLNVLYHGVHVLENFDRLIYSKRDKGPISNPHTQKRLDTILASFLIRHPVVDPITGKELVSLPKRTDTTVEILLGSYEQKIYDLIKDLPQSIFAKITRRRQACTHPLLLAKLLEAIPNDDHTAEDCGEICEESSTGSGPRISSKDGRALKVSDLSLELQACFSPKFLSAKLATVKKILQTRLPGQKTIIFISFVEVLPAILYLLAKTGIEAVQYTGDMTVMQRDSALNKIASDPNCRVIVVSMLAGGTGVNITSCDTVVILDPWWNPFVEEQAISRAHRIGQTRPVHVYRLITKDTIEECIVQTQKSKRETLKDLYSPCPLPEDSDYAAWLKK